MMVQLLRDLGFKFMDFWMNKKHAKLKEIKKERIVEKKKRKKKKKSV